MIRFFRTIRQSLLAQGLPAGQAGRITRYITYAIGEIVLVVIGILIALQVNNWNNERKAGLQEISLLKEMRKNLEGDLSDCQYNVRRNKELYNGITTVLRHLEERTPFHDSLRTHYGDIWGSTLQAMNTSAYNNLNSIGFDIVRNDSLRKSITLLYSERYPYIKRLETEFDNKIQLQEVLPQVNAKVIFDTKMEIGYPVDAESLMDDIPFKGLLRTNVFVRSFMLGRYQALEQELTALIAQIDTELESRRP